MEGCLNIAFVLNVIVLLRIKGAFYNTWKILLFRGVDVFYGIVYNGIV